MKEIFINLTFLEHKTSLKIFCNKFKILLIENYMEVSDISIIYDSAEGYLKKFLYYPYIFETILESKL